jgi:quercetin dioxygenase-like cupin family protein
VEPSKRRGFGQAFPLRELIRAGPEEARAALPIMRAGDQPSFEPPGTDGVAVTGLASPWRGATETVLYRIKMAARSTLPQHRHDHCEVFVVLSGSAVSVQGDREYRALAGDAVTIPAGLLHHARAGNHGAELLVAVPAGTRTFPLSGAPYLPPWIR